MSYNQKKISIIGIHILVWILLFMFPYFMFPDIGESKRSITHIIIPLLFYIIIFYVNYFWLTPVFLLNKRIYLFCLLNLILILLIIYISWEFRGFFMKMEMSKMNIGSNHYFHNRMPKPPVILFLIKDFFSFSIPIIFSIAIRTTQRWIKTETEKKEVENKQLESELLFLNYQLQPHFFFNSLNNIYSQIEIFPTKAQESIHALSKLMRYMLYEAKDEKVDLLNEIGFLKTYIQLMELRQTDKTKTTFFFPDLNNVKYSVAPFLMIPLIENAFKHGVSATKPSRIYFSISIFENELSFISGNSNFPKNESDISGSGIGIENLRKRLELIYPKRYDLNLSVVDDMFWVKLKIKM